MRRGAGVRLTYQGIPCFNLSVIVAEERGHVSVPVVGCIVEGAPQLVVDAGGWDPRKDHSLRLVQEPRHDGSQQSLVLGYGIWPFLDICGGRCETRQAWEGTGSPAVGCGAVSSMRFDDERAFSKNLFQMLSVLSPPSESEAGVGAASVPEPRLFWPSTTAASAVFLASKACAVSAGNTQRIAP